MRLTATNIKTLAPGDYQDAKGLFLRVYPSGIRAWSFRYTLHNMRQRLSLGTPEAVPLKKARELALTLQGDLVRGLDPKVSLNRISNGALTVADICQRVIDSGDIRPATRTGWKVLLKAHIADTIGRLPAAALSRDQIRTFGESVKRKSPYSSNRCFELIRRAFSAAVENGDLQATPFVRIPKPFKNETGRARVLSPEELGAIQLALRRLPCVQSDAVELALYTVCRKTATAGARTREFRHRGTPQAVWTVPAIREKGKVDHEVPITPQVEAILARIFERGSPDDHLFPRLRTVPTKVQPFVYVGAKYLERLRTEAGVEDWSLHTFRHTAATWLSSNGFKDAVPGILSHVEDLPAATRLYIHAAQLTRRREALEAWGTFLTDRLRTAEALEREAKEKARLAAEDRPEPPQNEAITATP